jgi:hypothetical protein
MRILLVVALVVGVLSAAVPPPSPSPVNDPATHLINAARGADAVTIEFYSPSSKEVVTFTDIFWIERLNAALAFSSYKPQSHCFCVSYPTIRLMRKKEILATLSVHHGEKLRCYAGSLSGDFLVGAKTGKTIVDLANEKRKPQSP